MSDYSFLDEMDQDYKNASESGGVPEGRYAVMVKSGEIKENKNKPGHHLLWTMVVTDGPQKGRYIWRRNAITKNSMDFLKQDLARAGIKMESLPELPDICAEEFPGRLLEVAVVPDGDYTKVYINKYVGMGNIEDIRKRDNEDGEGGEGGGWTEVAGDEEDLPF